MKTNLIDELHQAVKGKEHIIWDWNGTLLDDVGHAVSVMNGLLEEHHLPPLDRERYRSIFEFPVLHYYQALGFDFEKEPFESLCHRFVDRFMVHFRDLPLVPEMRSFLFQLHQEQRTQSVLSATDQPNLNSMISHFELGDIFRFVFGIDNKMAGSKLERGHELIKNSNILAEKTVIVGDTLHDLEVGRSLGIDVVLVSHGHQDRERLKAHYEVVI
ncbi:MAG: HAD family hydrolase [Bacteriovorax sp.]